MNKLRRYAETMNKMPDMPGYIRDTGIRRDSGWLEREKLVRKMKKIGKRKIIRIISRICFYIYMAFLVYFLLLSDGFGRRDGYSEYRYNLTPFLEIRRFIVYREYMDFNSVMINLVGNVIAFMPFGALIRWVLNRRVRWYQAVAYTFLFSLCVEVLQLVAKVGVFDVDDLILNTLGGLCGFFVYYILLLLNRRRERNAETEHI